MTWEQVVLGVYCDTCSLISQTGCVYPGANCLECGSKWLLPPGLLEASFLPARSVPGLSHPGTTGPSSSSLPQLVHFTMAVQPPWNNRLRCNRCCGGEARRFVRLTPRSISICTELAGGGGGTSGLAPPPQLCTPGGVGGTLAFNPWRTVRMESPAVHSV